MHHDFRTNVLALSILVVLAVPSGLLQAAIAQDLTVEDNLAQRIVYRTFQEITRPNSRTNSVKYYRRVSG
jgi:hypothetical protein